MYKDIIMGRMMLVESVNCICDVSLLGAKIFTELFWGYPIIFLYMYDAMLILIREDSILKHINKRKNKIFMQKLIMKFIPEM